jgi:hypothetical protein
MLQNNVGRVKSLFPLLLVPNLGSWRDTVEFSVSVYSRPKYWKWNSFVLGRHFETGWVNSHEQVFVCTVTHTVVLPWEPSCTAARRQVFHPFVTTANEHDHSILPLPPIFLFNTLSYELTQVFQTKSLGSSLKHSLSPKYLGRWACQRSAFLVHPLSEYHAYIPTIHPTSGKGWVEFPSGYVVFFFKSEMLNRFSFMMKFVPFWLDDMWSPMPYDGFSKFL